MKPKHCNEAIFIRVKDTFILNIHQSACTKIIIHLPDLVSPYEERQAGVCKVWFSISEGLIYYKYMFFNLNYILKRAIESPTCMQLSLSSLDGVHLYVETFLYCSAKLNRDSHQNVGYVTCTLHMALAFHIRDFIYSFHYLLQW